MSTTQRAFFLSWLCGACAAAGPERGPQYTPVASPEAVSPCQTEWKAAKDARERMMGRSDEATRAQTAQVVLAQAECEWQHFDELKIGAPTYEALMESVKPVRAQYLNALNLFNEVADYRVPRLAIAGYARAGDTHAAFAAKLRNTAPPSEMRAPGERAEFLGEMDEAAEVIDGDALKSWQLAADTAQIVPDLVARDDEVRAWLRSACAGLTRARKSHPLCVSQGHLLKR